MKIRLIIASSDNDYAEHLSRILADRYADTFEVGVCSTAELLRELLTNSKYDVALLEPGFIAPEILSAVRLPLLLLDNASPAAQNDKDLHEIKKYQRISSLAGAVLENYAELGAGTAALKVGNAHITAVWSPGGGTGKTTVALAYATRMVAGEKRVTYLNLENFSSVPVYFPESGKSISTVFQKLDSDVPMLLMGIRQQDSGTGIAFFGSPDNYDDMNILTVDDLNVLIKSCAVSMDEVVIDLSSQCDEKTWNIFDMADTVLLVCDPSDTSQAKMKQFMNQHNIAKKIRDKCILINNKGALYATPDIPKSIQLPLVRAADGVSVYKTLSGNAFEW